ncbi:Lrp/AsnC family transcriptional regulator [archaeon]|nr:Lrp/AsnC family transcriptional regulator [archaeon]
MEKEILGEEGSERKEFLQLIALLRKDARASLSKISRQIGVPISTVYDRLKRFEKGVIRNYTSIVDFSALGYGAHVCVLLKLEPLQRLKFQEFMLKCSHLNSFSKINNGFDFLLEFIFKDLREFEDYMDSLECQFRILDKHTFYIVNELKREQFLTNPQLVMIKGEA